MAMGRRAAVALLLCACAAGSAGAGSIPIQAWIHDPVIDSVRVSPSGEQLAALTLSDINEAPEITIWQTRDMALAPRRFKPADVKSLAVFWLNDEYLLVVGRQKFDYRYGSRPTKWFRDKLYVVDDEGRRFRELLPNKDGSKGVFDVLPRDKNKFLVEHVNREFASDIYEVDLGNFNARRVYRSASDIDIFSDHEGVIRGRQELTGSGDDTRISFSYKHPETGAWEVHHELVASRREGMQPVAFDPDGRHVYMVDNTGRERAVLRSYDLITRKLGEPIYGGGGLSATGVIQASNPEDFGAIIGFTGYAESATRIYTDTRWAAIQARLDEALPADQQHRVTSLSDDLTVMVVRSTGPREPGAYHMLVNGRQLVPLGRSYPLLPPDELASMEFVSYEARDGLEIPAFLTLPAEGEAPFPAVVVPHGGPWARDFLGWDLWAQFLANRGYAVLQPQYRGSEGWGQTLWRAGDKEWGQKMQDDKDDGARWLAAQGLSDAGRIAIFGYSYGGFAAMAASVRPGSPYQCAIAGAGLSELRSFDKVTYDNPFQRQYQNPTIAGMSPLDHVRDAAIPIYVFHGERDQRVPINQSEKFVRALRRAGKDVKYAEIVDLWHSLPWWPQHHFEVLSSIEEYLANDCGPNGL